VSHACDSCQSAISRRLEAHRLSGCAAAMAPALRRLQQARLPGLCRAPHAGQALASRLGGQRRPQVASLAVSGGNRSSLYASKALLYWCSRRLRMACLAKVLPSQGSTARW